MVNWVNMIEMLVIAFIGGSIQSTTGFGCGIFLMLFLPQMMSMMEASALTVTICLIGTIILAYTYRKNIQFKKIIPSVIIYYLITYVVIDTAAKLDVSKLKAAFGIFQILLSLYFMFFEKKEIIKDNLACALICGGIGGITNGFFGIGGPPVVVYLIATAKEDKKTYMGTCQMFFALTNSYNVILRAAKGYYSLALILLAIPGIIGVTCGKEVGKRIIEHIDIKVMKKIIYILLAVSGALTFFQSI